MEVPSPNIAVLSASVQKLLLTSLEPALQMAREIRECMAHASGESLRSAKGDDRRSQALALLLGK